MGLLLSPSFRVKDLRCYLDFASPRSYTSGNTVYDLTPHKNNATLFNVNIDKTQSGGVAVFNSPNSTMFIPKTQTLNSDPLSSRSTSFWFNVSSNGKFLPPQMPNVVYKEGDQRTGIIVYVDGDFLKCELYFNNSFYVGIEKKFLFQRNMWHNIILNYFHEPPYFDVVYDLQVDNRNVVSSTIQESTTLFYNGQVLQYNGEDIIVTGLDKIEPTSIVLGAMSGHSYINQSSVFGNGISSYNMRGAMARFMTRSNNVFDQQEISEVYDSFKGRFGASESAPTVTTHGLVCLLDPSNANSYNADKLWNDISYNDSDGFFANGSLSASDGKSIALDGVDESITITSNSLKYDTKQPFTRIIWFKYNLVNNTGHDVINLFSDLGIPGTRLLYDTLSGIVVSQNTLSERFDRDVFATNSNLFNDELPDLMQTNQPQKILNAQFNDAFSQNGSLVYPAQAILFQRDDKLFFRGYVYDNNFIKPILKDKTLNIANFANELLEIETPPRFRSVLSYSDYGIYLSAGNDVYFHGDSNIGITYTPNVTNRWNPLKSFDYNFNKISSTFGMTYALSGTKLFTGGYHQPIGTDDNYVFDIDALGMGRISSSLSITPLAPISASQNFNDVYAGYVHGFALSGNVLYGTGFGPYAGLGLAGFTRFTALTGQWERVVISDTNSFALSANTKKWFATGNNACGNLGLGTTQKLVPHFTPIAGEYDDIIISLATTFALSGNKWWYSGINPKLILSGYEASNIFADICDLKFASQSVNAFTMYKDYENDKIVSYQDPSFFGSKKYFYNNNFSHIFLKNVNTQQNAKTHTLSSLVEELTGWNMIAQSYDPHGKNSLYVMSNYEQVTVDAPLSDLAFSNINQYVIGQPGVGLNVGPVMIYNRALKLSEVMNNYKATKDAFIS